MNIDKLAAAERVKSLHSAITSFVPICYHAVNYLNMQSLSNKIDCLKLI